jgi:hypothetical protein
MQSRANPKQDGVLVCVDKEKCIDKYIPLEEVVIQGVPLRDVLQKKDKRIGDLETLVNKMKDALVAVGVLAVETAGKDIPHEEDPVY